MTIKARKILYLCADKGIPYWGNKGSSVHVREFVNVCRNSGCDIAVVARVKKKEPYDDKGIDLYPLHSPSEAELFDLADEFAEEGGYLAEVKSFYLNPHMEKLLKRIYSQYSFEIIYERYSLFSIAGLKFARKNKIPFIMEVNSPLVVETSRYRKLFLKDLAMAVEKRLFGGADHIIAVSSEVKNYILGIQPSARVTVVPNGVDTERFANGGDKADKETGVEGLSGFNITIGFVGRVRPWHGVDNLIDAFAEIANRSDGPGLVIVGDTGELKEKFAGQCDALGIDGRVRFIDAVAHEKIPSYLNAMDILVAPYPELSDFYFSALKIFEYMASGKAIVASRIGQIDQVLTHNKNALLVKPGDKKALTDALSKLIEDPELRSRLGENARQEAVEKHSWQKRFEMISGIFERSIQARGI